MWTFIIGAENTEPEIYAYLKSRYDIHTFYYTLCQNKFRTTFLCGNTQQHADIR